MTIFQPSRPKCKTPLRRSVCHTFSENRPMEKHMEIYSPISCADNTRPFSARRLEDFLKASPHWMRVGRGCCTGAWQVCPLWVKMSCLIAKGEFVVTSACLFTHPGYSVINTLRPLQNGSGGFGGGHGQYSHLATSYASVLSIVTVGGEALDLIDRRAMCVLCSWVTFQVLTTQVAMARVFEAGRRRLRSLFRRRA